MSSALLERITIEPGKCGGRPCIRGTRMRVSDVLELLANGATTEEVLADHPSLVRDEVLAERWIRRLSVVGWASPAPSKRAGTPF